MDREEETPTSAPTVAARSVCDVFLVIAGDDEHAEEIDPEIIGPFSSRVELHAAVEELPTWVLPPGEEHCG
jgi:hypothetical protein